MPSSKRNPGNPVVSFISKPVFTHRFCWGGKKNDRGCPRWPWPRKSLQLQAALNGMDEMDREIIALRHFEELSNVEAAHVLGLESSAASKRYIRALKRLQEILKSIPGLL
jgi:hypothetical protein